MTASRLRPSILVIGFGLIAFQFLVVGIGPTDARQEPSEVGVFPPTQEECDEYRTLRADAQAVEERFGPAEGDRVQLAEDCLIQEAEATPEPVTVALDQDANLICVQITMVVSVGSACTDADAPEPMVVTFTERIFGDDAESALVVIVDPQMRLGSVQTFEGGVQSEVFTEIQSDGLWLTAELHAQPYPEEVVVLDAQGQPLLTLRLNDDLATSQAAIEAAKQLLIGGEQ